MAVVCTRLRMLFQSLGSVIVALALVVTVLDVMGVDMTSARAVPSSLGSVCCCSALES